MVQVRNISINIETSEIDIDQEWDEAKDEIRKFIDDTDQRFNDLYNWIESLTLPEYTTAQRPDSAENGQMIYNSTTNRIELRQNCAWKYITTVSSV